MSTIPGIHHITILASQPQRNVDFYRSLLGQRLVKTTVNFDDPGTYHLYYGDEVGQPGTIMTFFPWPHARAGQRGRGEVAASAYQIPTASEEYWHARLAVHDASPGPIEERFGARVIPFRDPDGVVLELVTTDEPAEIQHWTDGPIPEEHALRGFHGVTLWVGEPEPTAALLTGPMGLERVGHEGNRTRFAGSGAARGRFVDLVVTDRPRGRTGAGTVHHVAFRAHDDADQLAYRAAIAATGLGVTEVKDRQYFRSIYFREPAGTLFEIATDPPGFTTDETVEQLGEHLKLPPWLEPRRDEIEQVLPPLAPPRL